VFHDFSKKKEWVHHTEKIAEMSNTKLGLELSFAMRSGILELQNPYRWKGKNYDD